MQSQDPQAKSASTTASNLRRYIILILAIAAVAFFLYKFRNSIAIQGFHWSMVVESVRRARIDLLILSVVMIYTCFAIRSLRWIRFCRAIYERARSAASGPSPATTPKPSFWNVYSATLMGFSCTFLLGRAGEPIRPVLIGKKESLPVPAMFGIYVLERVADMAATVVLAGAALVLFQQRGLPGAENRFVAQVRVAGALLLVLLVAAIAFLVYFRYYGAAWLGRRLQNPKWRTGWREKIAALLEGFSDGLQGIRTLGDLGVLIGYTTIHWICVTLVYVWVAHAFGGSLAQLTFTGALLVLAISMVGSAVQLPGVGGGAQLATFLVLTMAFRVESEPAATMAIVVWLIGFASCCLVGLPLLFREGWSMGELRRMAQEEERAGEAALIEEAEHSGEASRRLEGGKQKDSGK